MLRETHFWSAPAQRLRTAMIESQELTARIRRTELGVRIKFSDGRVSWLDKDANVSESGFLGSVKQWAQRRGAKTIEIEYE